MEIHQALTNKEHIQFIFESIEIGKIQIKEDQISVFEWTKIMTQ